MKNEVQKYKQDWEASKGSISWHYFLELQSQYSRWENVDLETIFRLTLVFLSYNIKYVLLKLFDKSISLILVECSPTNNHRRPKLDKWAHISNISSIFFNILFFFKQKFNLRKPLLILIKELPSSINFSLSYLLRPARLHEIHYRKWRHKGFLLRTLLIIITGCQTQLRPQLMLIYFLFNSFDFQESALGPKGSFWSVIYYHGCLFLNLLRPLSLLNTFHLGKNLLPPLRVHIKDLSGWIIPN